MAKLYATEAAGAYGVNPPARAAGNVVGAKVRRMRATFVSTGANNAIGDTIALGRIPIGGNFAIGRITASANGSAASLAIGSAANPTKYRAAAALPNAADTPMAFATIAALTADALTSEEEVLGTIGGAALPAGTYVVDIEYSTSA